MRVVILACVMVSSLVLFERAAVAQETSADQAVSDHSVTASGGKADASAVRAGAERVGSLSPDEERRAARKRARAVAAEKPAPTPVAADAPVTKPVEPIRAVEKDTPQPIVAAVPSPATHPATPARATTMTTNHARELAPRRVAAVSAAGRVSPGSVRRFRQAMTSVRYPRVGDLVPRNAPLFLVPPGYAPAPRYAEMRPAYGWGPRDAPLYPRYPQPYGGPDYPRYP